MMEVAVINIDGKETGRKVNLNETIFGIEPNDHAIYLDTKQYMAGQIQGTHKTRERAEVMGSTRKLKRQKGTGTARFGSIKNPQFRGGGRVFGPRPRYYGFKLNKKVKELARKSALTYKARENKIIILEDFSFDVPKTSKMAGISANLSLPNKKSVIVLPEQNNNIYLSSRNLQGVEVITVSDLNTYTIMKASTLVLTESVVDVLQSTL